MSDSHTHFIKLVLGQPIHSYNSTPSPLSSLGIAVSMPRKKTTRRSAPRVAPNTVFQQIAQRVRRNRLRSISLPAAPASVRQPDRVLPPSAVPSFSTPMHQPERVLAPSGVPSFSTPSVTLAKDGLPPSTLPSFSTPAVTPFTPRQPRPVRMLPSSPVSAESTSQQQNRARAQMK